MLDILTLGKVLLIAKGKILGKKLLLFSLSSPQSFWPNSETNLAALYKAWRVLGEVREW